MDAASRFDWMTCTMQLMEVALKLLWEEICDSCRKGRIMTLGCELGRSMTAKNVVKHLEHGRERR